MGDYHLSRKLARLLRHGAIDEGLDLSPEGYADIEDILQLPGFTRYSEEDVETVVHHDNKGRFKLQTFGGRRQIKATQGHSIPLSDSDLTPIVHFLDARMVLHGTRYSNWTSIKSQGLKKMNRTHIHFAAGHHVRSGFPPGCDIAIEINLEKALNDGLKFYKSSNDVILCPGNSSGVVSPRYFKRAYYINGGEELPLD